MSRLLSIEQRLQIIDEIETIFLTGEGMPTSATDDIMKKLQALKTDQSERTGDVADKLTNELVGDIKSQFYIFYQLNSNEDGDEETTEMLKGMVNQTIKKVK